MPVKNTNTLFQFKFIAAFKFFINLKRCGISYRFILFKISMSGISLSLYPSISPPVFVPLV